MIPIKLFTDKTFMKFIMVGVINTIVGTTIMFVFYNVFNLSYWVSSASNYFFGSIVSYILNKHFTFQYREKGWYSLIRFTLNILFCYLLAYGIAKPIMQWILFSFSKSIQENVSMMLGMCLFVVFNYLGQRFFAFRKKSLVLLLFNVLPLASQTVITSDEVKQTGLYTIEIITNNGEEPQGTVIESPQQSGSYNMTYANKVPCQIIISLNGNMLYDSGPYQNKTSGAIIRINGNTTAYYSDPLNMPYKIKLEKAADLLCRKKDKDYDDKHWRLLKDAVSMNTIVGLKLSQIIGLEWTSAFIPCNVIINGDYRGCYLLMETVKRNNECRIHCDKNTGYIVERDPYWWKEANYFSSSWYKEESLYRWTWKYPDEDELDEEREQYIQQYIDNMEQSLSSGNYIDYIDLSSWSKWILAHDILGTRDSGGANMYFKKSDNTMNSRLEMPCIWDFDSSYEVTQGSFSRLHLSKNSYFSTLFNNVNNTFAEEYVDLWNRTKEDIITRLTDFINTYSNSSEAISLNASRKLNNRRWNTNYGTVENNANKTLKWLENHIPLLDKNIQKISEMIAGINNEEYTDFKSAYNSQYYNLNGINIHLTLKRMIVIQRNKKNNSVRKFITNQ